MRLLHQGKTHLIIASKDYLYFLFRFVQISKGNLGIKNLSYVTLLLFQIVFEDSFLTTFAKL